MGSVLSSWYFGLSMQCLGVGRDAEYVYAVQYSSPCRLWRLTTNGVIVSSVALPGFSVSRGPSACHLGGAYIAIADSGTSIIRHVVKTTGSTVASFAVTPAGGGYLLDIGFNGTYYFAAGGSSHGAFNLYTTSGSNAGTWTAGGASAITSTGGYDYSAAVDNHSGDYIVIMSWTTGGTNYAVTYPGGSCVGSWVNAGANANGLMCGPSSFPAVGTCVWANMYDNTWVACYQIDLGNTDVRVTTVSLGRVKALYR